MDVESYSARSEEVKKGSEMGYFGVLDLMSSRVGVPKWSDLRSLNIRYEIK